MKTSVILILLIILSLILSISCEKDKNDNLDTICGTTDPLQQLQWLKNLINDLENAPNTEIYLYTYKEEKVFLIAHCAGCPDGVAEVYDCEGNVICVFGGISGMNTCPDFDSIAVKDSLIWENYGQIDASKIVNHWIYSKDESNDTIGVYRSLGYAFKIEPELLQKLSRIEYFINGTFKAYRCIEYETENCDSYYSGTYEIVTKDKLVFLNLRYNHLNTLLVNEILELSEEKLALKTEISTEEQQRLLFFAKKLHSYLLIRPHQLLLFCQKSLYLVRLKTLIYKIQHFLYCA